MDPRTIILSILVLFVVVIHCQSNSKQLSDSVVNSTDINLNENRTISDTPVVLGTNLQSLCTICSCGSKLVNCSERNLTNTFIAEQWPKTPIDEITFMKNTLIHITPFPSIVVQRLILRQNQITKIDNSAFKNIINLTELDLSHNQLTTEILIPHVFEGKFSPEAYEPLNLRYLNLANNLLHALNQDIFEHLGSLKVLILANNPLKVLIEPTSLAINNLPYLEELDLSYCDLEELPEYIFYKPRYLKKLQLNGNRFVEIPKALSMATALETLDLDETPIQTLNEQNAFPIMKNLKELNMCCLPNLIEIGNGSFGNLSGLEILRIQNCPLLKNIDKDALTKFEKEMIVWPPLKILDLSDNALRYLPSQLVESWDKLEELDLMNNEWSCDCDNQYLIDVLLPKHGKRLMDDEVNELKCSKSSEYYPERNLTSLANIKLHCLSVRESSNSNSKVGVLHIGVVVGLLFVILICLALIILYQRGYFIVCCGRGAATYSRAFYKRTPADYDI
ncbi:leucine-rich repeats and immunoglobulin-like domains protein 3 [Polistes fuscatus]|uniref:leucine-rich repeats and immunoglobulin-like domains protein 3 n=1 Tax=Polistes fuscatus TaxID=30207 RepID=UPI001CA94655|nr:leucine-rich repeats and immunoglobulin-like domains protein 3 [Polistes fuscatus]